VTLLVGILPQPPAVSTHDSAEKLLTVEIILVMHCEQLGVLEQAPQLVDTQNDVEHNEAEV
jgi:hypothetical protein